MTPLRAQMIDAMQMRGFSPRTHQSYLAAVAGLAGFYHRSPDTLTPEEVREYFTYLVITRQSGRVRCGASRQGRVIEWVRVPPR